MNQYTFSFHGELIVEAETEEDTQESRIPKELSEGDEATDFTAELTNEGIFKLSDYKDKTVILNFGATWCPPCVGEMPAFERLKADNNPNLEILCVNCAEDKQTVNDFVKENYHIRLLLLHHLNLHMIQVI